MVPPFFPTVFGYGAAVPFIAGRVLVNAVVDLVEFPGSTVFVNNISTGQTPNQTAAIVAIDVPVGMSRLEVVVHNGLWVGDSNTYVVFVTRERDAVRLANILSPTAPLSSPFFPTLLNYTATVSWRNDVIQVGADYLLANAAFVRVDGHRVNPGDLVDVAIAGGATEIVTIDVIPASEALLLTTYTVTYTRQA
eukprot:7499160-Pyramimonas_sp.AAC.1